MLGCPALEPDPLQSHVFAVFMGTVVSGVVSGLVSLYSVTSWRCWFFFFFFFLATTSPCWPAARMSLPAIRSTRHGGWRRRAWCSVESAPTGDAIGGGSVDRDRIGKVELADSLLVIAPRSLPVEWTPMTVMPVSSRFVEIGHDGQIMRQGPHHSAQKSRIETTFPARFGKLNGGLLISQNPRELHRGLAD